MIYDLVHSEENPRISEGSFVRLADSSILFAIGEYSGYFGDNSSSHIRFMRSRDNGESWQELPTPELHFPPQVCQRSISLLRLSSGKILMADLAAQAENSQNALEVRASLDEGKSWSAPRLIAPQIMDGQPIRIIMNNDRMVQLSTGRIIAPVALCELEAHAGQSSRSTFFYSDDDGESWQVSKSILALNGPSEFGLQEPGVLEKQDGSLLAYFRTNEGCHYFSRSTDGGESWSDAIPDWRFKSPLAPLSMKRAPGSGTIFAIWNDYSIEIPNRPERGRTPLVLAKSEDDGDSWTRVHILEDNPKGGYCYTAMHFTDDNALLLAYCCGVAPQCTICLQDTRIRKIPLESC